MLLRAGEVVDGLDAGRARAGPACASATCAAGRPGSAGRSASPASTTASTCSTRPRPCGCCRGRRSTGRGPHRPAGRRRGRRAPRPGASGSAASRRCRRTGRPSRAAGRRRSPPARRRGRRRAGRECATIAVTRRPTCPDHRPAHRRRRPGRPRAGAAWSRRRRTGAALPATSPRGRSRSTAASTRPPTVAARRQPRAAARPAPLPARRPPADRAGRRRHRVHRRPDRAQRRAHDDDRRRSSPSASGASARRCERFLDFGDGPTGAVLVDNLEWTAPLAAIEFLRDVGAALPGQPDAGPRVGERAAGGRRADLHRVQLQAAAVDGLRRAVPAATAAACRSVATTSGATSPPGSTCCAASRARAAAHALTFPLVTDAAGHKIGKSTGGGNVWLDAGA